MPDWRENQKEGMYKFGADRLSADSQPILDRYFTDAWPILGRYLIDT